MDMNYTAPELKSILAEAEVAAHNAAMTYFTKTLGGKDSYPCGFAWVEIHGVKGNTKLGRAMKAAGIRQSSYSKVFEVSNMSGLNVQNVSVKEEAAGAASAVLSKYGFRAYPCSRLD